MPTYTEKRRLPFQAKQIFNLVADVEKYPEFLPWIQQVNIVSRQTSSFIADVQVGYQLIHASYRSEVLLTPFQSIDIRYISGPFQHLTNRWQFHDINENEMEVDFFIDFEFQSASFQFLFQSAFEEVVKRMIIAFEKRAGEIYR